MNVLMYTLAMLQPYVDLRTGELMAEVSCMPYCLALACLARAESLAQDGLQKHSACMITCTLMFKPHCRPRVQVPTLHTPCIQPCLQTADL